MDEPAVPQLQGCQGLEQFLLLAKTARGPAAVELIKQTMEASGVYVFGELLETECVRELAAGPSAGYVQLLEIFAFGTYGDYKKNAASLPALSATQLTKLKHLTIISLAAKCRIIPYATLLQELDITNLRELEDLIIEATYAGIMHAKLDQKNAQLRGEFDPHPPQKFRDMILRKSDTRVCCHRKLEVECFIGRDIKMEALDGMAEKLENWCTNCASVLQIVEQQIQRANDAKVDRLKDKEKAEQELKRLKQTMKVAASPEDDILLPREPKTLQPKKGLRGSAAQMKLFVKK